MSETSQLPIESKAYALPVVEIEQGKRVVPVVVRTEQGSSLSPASRYTTKRIVHAAPDNEGLGRIVIPQQQQNKIRLFHLVEDSAEMVNGEQGERKIDILQNNIDQFLSKVEDMGSNFVEHVLVLFGQGEHIQPDDIECLTKRNLTATHDEDDIHKAIAKVDKPSNTEAEHNLALWYSASDTGADIKQISDELEAKDTGLIKLGLGSQYARDAARNAIKRGGLMHISPDDSANDASLKLLPEVIEKMVTATHAPIISFNRYFDRVVNLSPTMREVEAETIGPEYSSTLGSDEHKAARVGHQTDSYVLGFILEDDFNLGSINRIANDEVNEIPIESFENTSEKEQSKLKAMALAGIKSELVQQWSPKAIQNFFVQLNDVNHSAINDIGSMTSSGTIHSMISKENQFAFLAEQDAEPMLRAEGLRSTPDDLTVKARNNSSQTIIMLKPFKADDNPSSITQDIAEGQTVSIGRNGDGSNEIVVKGQYIGSNRHATITRRDGVLYITNHHKNGTKVNGKTIEEETRLKTGDLVTLTDQSFRVSFAS